MDQIYNIENYNELKKDTVVHFESKSKRKHKDSDNFLVRKENS